MTVSDIMTRKVQTLTPDNSFETVREIFRKVSFHHLVVVNDHNELKGILSDRDMMAQIALWLDRNNGESFTDFLPRLTVGDVMTRDVITVDAETSIDTASVLLLENRISSLPVIDADQKVIGIVTWKDLLKYYVYE